MGRVAQVSHKEAVAARDADLERLCEEQQASKAAAQSAEVCHTLQWSHRPLSAECHVGITGGSSERCNYVQATLPKAYLKG